VRFHSTHGEADKKTTSLADYVSRMKDKQDAIYYISGENLETVKNSPQLEGFRSRGIEVLFFTDTIDDFWLQSVQDFGGKKFVSVTKGNIALPDAPQEKEETAKKPEADSKLTAALRDILKEEVGDVRASNRLTESPVCLIAGEGEVDLRMERVLRIHQKYQPQSKRVLEINPRHPLLLQMAKLGEGSAELKDAAYLLLDQARIIQGEPVPDPAAFARRMAQFMEKGLAA
jgi:molecular chaperone HtpG